MNNIKPAHIGIGAVVVIALAYFFYFQEYFAFQELKENPNKEYAFQDFYYEYPNSRYKEEAKLLEIDTKRDIKLVRDYLREFPDGSGTEQVTAMKNELWDEEIKKYDDLVAGKEATTATKFFRDILTHMKDKNSSTIYVDFIKNINLKDLEDFGEESVAMIDLLSDPGRKISENMLPLKANFSEGSISTLEQIVDEGIKESFEEIFTDNFITVARLSGTAAPDDLVVKIDYTIHNELMEGYELPNIWEYTSDDVFQSYLLGVAISFKFDFAIPGTEQVYAFEQDANPGENISNISNIAEGYQRMTQITFASYANHISDQFGLQGAYFKEEPEVNPEDALMPEG